MLNRLGFLRWVYVFCGVYVWGRKFILEYVKKVGSKSQNPSFFRMTTNSGRYYISKPLFLYNQLRNQSNVGVCLRFFDHFS